MSIHLIKLIVGLSTVDEFAQNQERWLVPYEGKKANVITTRHRPKRAEELIAHGSAYRVMKNTILFRQKIIGFDSIEHPEKGRMCLVLCDPEIILVQPTPRRPFQGWRYFQPEDVPADLDQYNDAVEDGDLELAQTLRTAGLL